MVTTAAPSLLLPLLVLLDDIHWAAPATLDLLRDIAREIQTLPMLLLATHRPQVSSGGNHGKIANCPASTRSPVNITPVSGTLITWRLRARLPTRRTQHQAARLIAVGREYVRWAVDDPAVARLAFGAGRSAGRKPLATTRMVPSLPSLRIQGWPAAQR